MFSRASRILRLFNRISCTVALKKAGVPMPTTVLTADPGEAAAAVDAFGKCVCKPIYSTKARGMKIIERGRDALDQLTAYQNAGNPVFYLQKLVNLPGRDLGVVFLGGEYLATYARVAKTGEWNTTTQSGGRYIAVEPSTEVMEVAKRAQAAFELDFTCVDVAESENGPVVFEVSAFGGFRGLRDSHGMNVAERYVDYVLKNIASR
jgi:ribosomal protein S6--L-glutamate ligase